MNSRTSLFNKSLFKSDMKRYWWICLAETVLMFFMTVIPIYYMCHRALISGYSFDWDSRPWLDTGSIVIVFVFAISVPVILMSYIHFQASVSAHHALPIKRSALLTTKAASGILLISVPILLNGVALILMRYVCGFGDLYTNTEIIRWIASGLIYSYVLFSLTMLVNQMTGNPIGTLVFTVGFTLLPLLLAGFFGYFLDTNLYGYKGDISSVINYIYVSEADLFKAVHLLTYIAFIAAFTAGAYVLYGKRKLESYGEVIAFGGLKPVFVTVIAILSSALSYLYFKSIFNVESALWLIPIGLVGTVIAWIISRKKLSLRGCGKPILIYLGVTLAFWGAIKTDITGFERRVPDFDGIESVSVTDGITYRYSNSVYVNGKIEQYTPSGGIDMEFTDSGDIKNVRELHEYKIENRTDSGQYMLLPIKYKLKNGREIEREYRIDMVADAKYLKPIYETEQMKAEKFAIADGVDKEYQKITVSDRRIENGEVVLYPDNAAMERLAAALKKDIENVSYENYMINGGGATVIDVEYKVFYDDARAYDYFGASTYQESYCIREDYENTMAVLDELGFYDKMTKAEDIAEVEVRTWIGDDDGVEPVTVAGDEGVKTLYDLFTSMVEERKYSDDGDDYNINLMYTTKSGYEFRVSCTYDYDRIPTELLRYFDGV